MEKTISKWRLVVIKWDAFSVSLFSMIYGAFLISHPHFFDGKVSYHVLAYLFDSNVFGMFFLLLGLAKIISIIFDIRILRIVSISLLTALRTLFATSLYSSPVLNTVFMFAGVLAVISFGIGLKEWIE